MMSLRSSESGSALLSALLFLVLLSTLAVLLVEKMSTQKKVGSSVAISYQATLAAQSGLTAAVSQLGLATRTHPQALVAEMSQQQILEKSLQNFIHSNSASRTSFNVTAADQGQGGEDPRQSFTAAAEAQEKFLVVGATNLTTQGQLMPLFSGDLSLLIDFPAIPQEKMERYLQTLRESGRTVDLNLKNRPIAASGCYSAPWVTITNSAGDPIARYAYRFFDEQARLHPALHQGKARTDPDNWDQGPSTLPLVLEDNFLFSEEEAASLQAIASHHLAGNGFSTAFRNHNDFENKKHLLSRCTVALPDFIPSSLPDGGKPKYDLNDLATNTTYGLTKSERAIHLADIIDLNLPHFKERDPSLRGCSAADQRRYLYRLAACIIDYINPPSATTLVNGGEPAGQILSPLVTQTAERLRLQSCSSNSVTMESQYFVQVWNPYTRPIPSGGILSFSVDHRPYLYFGAAKPIPFEDYHQSVTAPTMRPNESIVLAFPTVTQTWSSPTPVASSHSPYWLPTPEEASHSKHHQTFEFYWNHQLVEMSRHFPVGPGLAEGGLENEGGSLSTRNNYWHCNFIPTEKDREGHFRFVGDPRDNYLSNYLWKSYAGEKSYVEQTRWQGVMSDASSERQFDPASSWRARDFIPINPAAGNHPASIETTPDHVPSSYREEYDALHAPLVMRHGPMNSIVELGNIHDPAQADDVGAAPDAGYSDHQTSVYACGGGRTLRIGQPEFFYWDTAGKRAIELLDLFTLSLQNEKRLSTIPYQNSSTLRIGLINVNTASHAVLTALFDGITPTSDQRFLHSQIRLEAAERLATLLEEHRPYEKLSDLRLLTPLLANAETYSPPLSSNVTTIPYRFNKPDRNNSVDSSETQGNAESLRRDPPSDEVPSHQMNEYDLAAVFDRAREEGFAKMISLCTLHSRAFRIYILAQTLDRHGQASGEAMMEAIVTLTSTDSEQTVTPVVQEIKWL